MPYLETTLILSNFVAVLLENFHQFTLFMDSRAALLHFLCAYLLVGGNSTESPSLDIEDTAGMRTSKSDTSLTDSFIVVPEPRKRPINPHSILRPGKRAPNLKQNSNQHHIITFIFILGFMWQRQLVFRSKLTMHTAYDRKDNSEPASITALAVSK